MDSDAGESLRVSAGNVYRGDYLSPDTILAGDGPDRGGFGRDRRVLRIGVHVNEVLVAIRVAGAAAPWTVWQ